MEILIACVGTRGDVQPYIALGLGFQQQGHRVRLVTDPTYRPLVERAGLLFYPARTDPVQLLQEGIKQVGLHSRRLFLWMARRARRFARAYFHSVAEACCTAEAVVFSPLAFPAAHLAEAYKLPFIGAYLQPATPTRAFPSPLACALERLPSWFPQPLRGALNYGSYRLVNWSFTLSIYKTVNACRRELGLLPKPLAFYLTVDVQPVSILYGFSPRIVPKPPDWGSHIHVTGYWFWEEEPAIPADLSAFLEAGPPPLYIGFGSLPEPKPVRLQAIVRQVLEKTGERALLQGAWAEDLQDSLPDGVKVVQDISHMWLFPRCRAVVHHGGAGTTAAALRAGVPQVIVPAIMDQPFWAWRAYALGVGPKSIPRARLTAERLLQALKEALTSSALRQKAQDIARIIQQEAGVERAVSLALEHFHRAAPPTSSGS